MGSCKEGERRVTKIDLIQRMMCTKTTEINMHIISCESISYVKNKYACASVSEGTVRTSVLLDDT